MGARQKRRNRERREYRTTVGGGETSRQSEGRDKFDNPAAGPAGAVIAPSEGAVRAALSAGICPWCGRGPYKIVASHVSRSHGVGGRELREMAGLPWTASICDTELAAARSAITKSRGLMPPRFTGKGQKRAMSPAGRAIIASNAPKYLTGRPINEAQRAAAVANGKRRGEQLKQPRGQCQVCGSQIPYVPGKSHRWKHCGSEECRRVIRSRAASARRGRPASPAQATAARAAALKGRIAQGKATADD